jgi:uncharacterized protein (UPF0332 family)
MNLFKLNKDLAVKLNQSFDTLYEMDYGEYSLLLNIINEETEKQNSENDIFSDAFASMPELRVNLPDNLKIK